MTEDVEEARKTMLVLVKELSRQARYPEPNEARIAALTTAVEQARAVYALLSAPRPYQYMTHNTQPIGKPQGYWASLTGEIVEP